MVASSSMSALFSAPTHILPPATALALKFFELVLPAASSTDEHDATHRASPTVSSQTLSNKLDALDDEHALSDSDDDVAPSQAPTVAATAVEPAHAVPAHPVYDDDLSFMTAFFASALTVVEAEAPSSQTSATPKRGRGKVSGSQESVASETATPARNKRAQSSQSSQQSQSSQEQEPEHDAPKSARKRAGK